MSAETDIEPAVVPAARQPKFSAIITCHNYENYVAQAILSVAHQTYRNFECIILDDASTDNSAAVIAKTLKALKDKRFSFVTLEKKAGQALASLEGLNRASGIFVGFLDADDWWEPDFIAIHVAAHLNTQVSVGITCSDVMLVNGQNELMAKTWNGFTRKRGTKNESLLKPGAYLPAPEVDDPAPQLRFHEQKYPAHWQFCPSSSLTYRRDLVESIFPRAKVAGMMNIDVVLAVVASTMTGWISIAKPLSAYRMHGKNLFSRNLFVGGRSWNSGEWTAADKARLSRHMVDSLMENLPALQRSHETKFLLMAIIKVGSASKFYTAKALLKIAMKANSRKH